MLPLNHLSECVMNQNWHLWPVKKHIFRLSSSQGDELIVSWAKWSVELRLLFAGSLALYLA
jgi:hypothetical protein